MADNKPQMMQAEHYQEDLEEEGRVVEADVPALTQLNAAEINQQIMTARAYPRNLTDFRRAMRELVTYDQPTALSCLYALKRGNKVIEGPSIRFAEGALQAWGNARAGSRIVDIGEEFITAQGFFYDLQRNMALAFEVMRRITDSEGRRYGDDMIGVTGNAASSIAFRNAILKGIPKIAWNESYQAARAVSIGKGESITVKRDEMVKAFAPLGVDKEQIFGLLGVKGIDDVSIDHMIFMGGILNSIKEGDAKAEVVFAVENMVNPGQVAPSRPRASEFTRKDTADKKGAGVEKIKDDDKKPLADQPADSKPAGETAPPSDPKVAARADQEAWLADQHKELENTTRVRDVADLQERVAAQLFPDQEDDWTKACTARSKAIMKSTSKK